MGQRCHNPFPDFDGAFLDWNALLGSGFDEAPRGWVSVFRVCSLEELVRIAREGMAVPPPDLRPAEIRREMETLDRFRPPAVVRRGISRLGAIYASPTAEDAPRLPFRKERIILEMKVDPAQGWVGDMDFITCLIPFIGAQPQGLDRFQGAFHKYWESVIPFADFRRHYEKVSTADGFHWLAKGRTPLNRPRSFFLPEILVMTPLISQRHIRVVSQETVTEAPADGRNWPAR